MVEPELFLAGVFISAIFLWGIVLTLIAIKKNALDLMPGESTQEDQLGIVYNFERQGIHMPGAIRRSKPAPMRHSGRR